MLIKRLSVSLSMHSKQSMGRRYKRSVTIRRRGWLCSGAAVPQATVDKILVLSVLQVEHSYLSFRELSLLLYPISYLRRLLKLTTSSSNSNVTLNVGICIHNWHSWNTERQIIEVFANRTIYDLLGNDNFVRFCTLIY